MFLSIPWAVLRRTHSFNGISSMIRAFLARWGLQHCEVLVSIFSGRLFSFLILNPARYEGTGGSHSEQRICLHTSLLLIHNHTF